ncbi:HNH endonuclease [Pelosinus baikalensis]|uniref:HNH endonuclease n=1 Tax=Pelosinus baikalensis TaxID=2892015 RepID=A0ABS8HQT7_9FIRM|nr:HNH endonuclease [Pelosinus baikalensis]MCC5465530.1 HNH endonuclease [Pelosinus baikalensis]
MANIINDNTPKSWDCSYCGAKFNLSTLQRYNYRNKNARKFYCNKICYHNSTVGHECYIKKNPSIPIDGFCSHCKKHIILTQTQRKRIKINKNYNIYCSKDCSNKNRIDNAIKIVMKCDGCGESFIASENQRLIPSEKKYCNNECYHKHRTGEKNPNWNGGKVVDKNGYIYIHYPSHPNANCNGYVFEHRLIVEKHLGRYLRKDEIVHHKDENKNNNCIENLQVMSNEEHIKYHYEKGTYKLNGAT